MRGYLMLKAFAVLLVLAVVGGVGTYLFTGTPKWGKPLSLKDGTVSSIELYWGGTTHRVKGADQCAPVVQTLREARQNPASSTPPYGTLTLHYADGTTNLFSLLASRRFSGLEIANDGAGYAISMPEMLGAFQRAGLLTKDQ